MSESDWRIRGIEITNCNCHWGCPCQFNSLPSSGQCEAVWAMRIEEGHYGDTRLDGLVWGFLVWWPGAVHEGNGRMQVFGEQRAGAQQRQALVAIATGQSAAEGTYFQIFSAMAPNVEPAVWAPITFQADLAARTGRLSVEGLVESRIEPIRNPVTGALHSARLLMPDGFEFREAEFASGTTRSDGVIALDVHDTHAHLARVGWDRAGRIAD